MKTTTVDIDHAAIKAMAEKGDQTAFPPAAPPAPPAPKIGWWKRWKERRADKRHEKWMRGFMEELAKPESRVHQTVLVQADQMARGMVMRHFDDRGITRCRLCLSTDQLVKRILERKRGPNGRWLEKTIYLCPAHKDVQLPAPKPVAPAIPVAAPAGST